MNDESASDAVRPQTKMRAIVVLLAASLAAAQRHRAHNLIRGGPGKVMTPLPYTTLPRDKCPDAVDWRTGGSLGDGVNYAISDKNQYVPEYCGSCWAHAATAALSDRIKIARKAAWPDIEISRQVLLNCLDTPMAPQTYGFAPSCNGGDPYAAYLYMHTDTIPDETCAAYVAGDQVCTPAHICKGLDGGPQPEFRNYTVSQFGMCARPGRSGLAFDPSRPVCPRAGRHHPGGRSSFGPGTRATAPTTSWSRA